MIILERIEKQPGKVLLFCTWFIMATFFLKALAIYSFGSEDVTMLQERMLLALAVLLIGLVVGYSLYLKKNRVVAWLLLAFVWNGGLNPFNNLQGELLPVWLEIAWSFLVVTTVLLAVRMVHVLRPIQVASSTTKDLKTVNTEDKRFKVMQWIGSGLAIMGVVISSYRLYMDGWFFEMDQESSLSVIMSVMLFSIILFPSLTVFLMPLTIQKQRHLYSVPATVWLSALAVVDVFWAVVFYVMFLSPEYAFVRDDIGIFIWPIFNLLPAFYILASWLFYPVVNKIVR